MAKKKYAVTYTLTTTTEAAFDNLKDATAYYDHLTDDEPDGSVVQPRRNPNDGTYVVSCYKQETVQHFRL